MPDPKEQLLIAVDDAHLPRFDAVVKRLRRAGLEVDQAMAALGTVTGAIEPEKVEALSDIAGVAHVERARQVRAR